MDKYKTHGVNVPNIDASKVLIEKLCNIINPIQYTGIIKIKGLMKILLKLINKHPIKACSEAFLSWNMLRIKNKEIMNNVNARWEPFAIWVSFHVLIKKIKMNIGRNVRVRIMVNLLLSCVSKKAFSKVKTKATRLDKSVLGNKNDCSTFTILLL